MFGLSRYQWFVLFAAWLGWGFDVFDGLLFNYVAPVCVPNLLGLDPHDPHVRQQTLFWTATLTSLLLLGWALGGIIFGKITDRLGRTRTLLLTMLTYALATAACAAAPNLWTLAGLRFIASLGIGGEWAAGAALVAETMPASRRVLGGALLYTSAPAGLFLATFVNDLFTRKLNAIALNPNLSWRLVFLTGIVPAVVAILIRINVREPEVWRPEKHPRIRELFEGDLARRTLGGLAMAVVALVTWWSCSAFIPVVASFLTSELRPVPVGAELARRKTELITLGATTFNIGGLLGTLLTVPIATHFGRRPMFAAYFLASAAAILLTFALPWPPHIRLIMMFTVGLTVFGVFGSFTFYLPELFPVRLRGTGAGFTYNVGRIITAAFPFAVGWVARSGKDPLEIMSFVAVVPALGCVAALAGVALETRKLNL
ncbi:MAG TPA: MFS transporter [Polyangiaceae bacterium]|jgi:MFS family permease